MSLALPVVKRRQDWAPCHPVKIQCGEPGGTPVVWGWPQNFGCIENLSPTPDSPNMPVALKICNGCLLSEVQASLPALLPSSQFGGRCMRK